MEPFLSLSDFLSFDPGLTELPILVFQVTPYLFQREASEIHRKHLKSFSLGFPQ